MVRLAPRLLGLTEERTRLDLALSVDFLVDLARSGDCVRRTGKRLSLVFLALKSRNI